jgi:hypothetical protein
MLIIFSCPPSYIQGQNHVSFFEEHIDFTLDTDYFIINGIYSFSNETESEVSQQIIFPFADKTAMIDSIRIINLSTERKIQFNRLENSVLFNFMLLPKDTVDVNIFYRQKISTVNKYIITSTQSWGKPLETAVYTLTTDKNLKIKSFTYVPDSIRDTVNKRLYIWKKQHFMPKIDFEITIDK